MTPMNPQRGADGVLSCYLWKYEFPIEGIKGMEWQE